MCELSRHGRREPAVCRLCKGTFGDGKRPITSLPRTGGTTLSWQAT